MLTLTVLPDASHISTMSLLMPESELPISSIRGQDSSETIRPLSNSDRRISVRDTNLHTELSERNGYSPGSPRPSTSTAIDQGVLASEPCGCLSSSLKSLDVITASEASFSLSMVPQIIYLNKRVLMRIKPLLNCPHCYSRRTIATLLTVLCQKLISSYEDVVTLLAKQYRELHQIPDEANRGVDSESTQAEIVQLRDYEVELKEEPCVFVGVITLQLGILRTFLSNLKATQQDKSDAHITLVEAIDSRVLKLGHFINTSCQLD